MKSVYCIECGRELAEYLSETLHHCNICESIKLDDDQLFGKHPIQFFHAENEMPCLPLHKSY
jgi:phospholipid N-methyltransferase